MWINPGSETSSPGYYALRGTDAKRRTARAAASSIEDIGNARAFPKSESVRVFVDPSTDGGVIDQ
jgi:hypothetical protein